MVNGRFSFQVNDIQQRAGKDRRVLVLDMGSGGMFFDLGYYEDALSSYDHSIAGFGLNEDVSYNKALCFYQLNRDKEFLALIGATEVNFPTFDRISELKQLLN